MFRNRPTPRASQDAHEWFTPGRFALLLALFILTMFPDVILGGRTFIFRDFGLFGYPLAYYYRGSFWRGEVPLWNPLSHCGIPFLAQWNTLVLYPGSLFYLLLPLDWSLGIFNLLHLFLCGVTMYALAFRWTGNRLAATIAGLGFAFNGFTLNCLIWPNYIASLAWMPLVVLTVERAWRLGGRQLVLAALAGAMQMFSGTPEVILLTWLLLTALWLLQLCQADPPRRQVFLRMLSVGLLVAGLAAAQLLPFLDLLRASQRSPGLVADEWAMPITGWANFLVPLFRTFPNGAGVHFQDSQYITSSYYLGISMTALALIAAWRVRERRVRLCAVLTGVCLLLALGRAGGAYTVLLKAFPPLGLMRFPVKFVMLPVFLVPLLAAFAVSTYLAAAPEARSRFCRSGLVVGALFLLTIALLIGFAWRHPGPEELWPVTVFNGLTRAAFLVAILGLWFAVGRVSNPRLKWTLALSLTFLVWLDVATHAPRQNPSAVREVLQPGLPPLTRLQPRPAPGESRAMLSLQAILVYRTLTLTNATTDYLAQRLALYNNSNLIEGLPKVDGFFALVLRDEEEVRSRLYPASDAYRAPLADFLSVSQVTSATNLLEWTARPTALPMATAGQKPLFLDPTNTLAALIRADFDPRAAVFLRPEDQVRVSVTGRTAARIISSNWSPHRITLVAEAAEPALVVISQCFYHNWRAYVGDQPTPLLRANYAFQALQVPAGRQQVTLVYEDRAFYCGALVSLISAAVCIAIWLRRHQRPLS
ncbi:MAG: hypothetical protein ACLQU3_00730 [Limisphaerales bacterium]